MDAWGLPLFLTAAVLFAATFIKLAKAKTSKATAIVSGLLAFAICLAINTSTVYEAIDALLGGKNLAYLAVQITFLAGMFFLKVAFVNGRSATNKIIPVTRTDIALVLIFSGLIILFFLLSDLPHTSYRVHAYRDQWSVAAFTQALNLYAGALGIQIAIRVFKKWESHRPDEKLKRWSFFVIASGFSLGAITVVERVTFQIIVWSSDIDTSLQGEKVDGILVVCTLALIAVGSIALFAAKTKEKVDQQRVTRPRFVVQSRDNNGN